jgi:hypothetical protein
MDVLGIRAARVLVLRNRDYLVSMQSRVGPSFPRIRERNVQIRLESPTQTYLWSFIQENISYAPDENGGCDA